MTVKTATLEPTVAGPRVGAFLGVGTVFRKELTEWLRGPKTIIVAAISIVGAIFMTLIPFIAKATNEADEGGLLTMDPTTNVLLGWTGQTVAFIAVVATMTLLSTERDRGTLAWSLSNPVSPTAVLAAKAAVAMVVLMVSAVLLPMLVSIGVATVAYSGLPDLGLVGAFAVLFLALPAFYVALTIAAGTVVKSTAGVAGVAFAVMFAPQVIGGIVPFVNEFSPTSIGTWAMAVAKGQPASAWTLGAWIVSMVVLLAGAKVAFDRQEH